MATSQAAARSGEQTGEAGQTEKRRNVNVGRTERNASMVSGAALALTGLERLQKRHFIPGLAMLAVGGIVFYRGKTGHSDMYEALGVNTAGSADTGVHIEKSMTVNRPMQEVHNFWRRLENLPRFMRHLESVQVTGDRTSHWRAAGPAGVTTEWDAEIVEDSPGRISWKSIGEADIPNEGVVEFHDAPGGRGTEVKVRIFYHPPAGTAGKVAAQVLNSISAQQIEEDLKRFKQVMETGETSTAEMAPGARVPRAGARSFMPGGGARV